MAVVKNEKNCHGDVVNCPYFAPNYLVCCFNFYLYIIALNNWAIKTMNLQELDNKQYTNYLLL